MRASIGVLVVSLINNAPRKGGISLVIHPMLRFRTNFRDNLAI